MLTCASPDYRIAGAAEDFFADLRKVEFARLDRTGQAYLDYTGSALYSERQIRAWSRLLEEGVFGNPHSESAPSQASALAIEDARERLLQFLDAPADDYVVCFTANTSAAVKLVGESFPFCAGGGLVLSTDNHNSMNGLREFAARRGASVTYLPLDDELRLDVAEDRLESAAINGRKLFGFPAQSNFSGVKHPLSLVTFAQSRGYSVLLDAAAYAPTNQLSLQETPVDYLALSMYKILGFPTGVGALVARRDALACLERPWFAGGTVEYASVQNGSHLLRPREAGFEDGTPAFLDIAALAEGFDFIGDVGLTRINARVMALTAELLERLQGVHLDNGSPAVLIYGPADLEARGATIAFNVLGYNSRAIPYQDVELRARDAGVAVRGGCFCNPGASEAAFGFPAEASARCQATAASRGFSVEDFASCLGQEFAVGAVRVSPGLATSANDIDRLIKVVESYC